MRVFLDTNVLASAVATRGLCEDVFREVLASHELLTSTQVLSELKRVLRTKFRLPRDLMDDFIQFIKQDSLLVHPGPIPAVDFDDKEDLIILSAAIAGGADVLVTGDKGLLDVGPVENLAILSPRQFWEKLKGQSESGG